MLWLVKKIFRLLFWLSGWKFRVDIPPEIDKAVMVLAGHTSNWDFFYAIGSFDQFGKPARFTIKKEWLDVPIIGPFFRFVGAFGIDRRKKNSAVDQMVDEMNSWDKGYMCVTAEGTRRRVDKWKTGFYYIALGAKVPIILSYIDFKKKQSGLGKVIYPTGDYSKDMQEILEFYSHVTPKRPELFSLDNTVGFTRPNSTIQKIS